MDFLQRELRQDCNSVKVSQSCNHLETEGFIVLQPLLLEIYGSPEKKVTPLCACAKHCHLYLVIIAVSALQLNTTVFTFQTVTLIGSNGVTHSEIPVAVGVLKVN